MQSLAERRTVFFEFLLFLFSGLLCLAIPSLIIFRQPFLFLTFFYILFSMRRWVRSSLIPVEALGFSRAREGWGVFWFSLVGILLAFFFVAILFPQTIQLEQIRRENALMPVMSVPMIVAYYVFVSVPLQEIVFRVFLLNRLQMCFSFFVKGKLAGVFFKLLGLLVILFALFNITNGANLGGINLVNSEIKNESVMIAKQEVNEQIVEASFSNRLDIIPRDFKVKNGKKIKAI